MSGTTTWLLVAATIFGAGPRDTSAPAAAGRTVASQAVISHCQVFLIQDIEVPAKEAGAIVAINVAEGNQVQSGAVLARIDDRQAQFDKIAAELKRDAALAKSEDDIEVRFAEAALGVADAELSQNLDINRHSRGTISDAEIRRLKFARQKAQLQIDRSRLEMKIAAMTGDIETTAVAVAEDHIERRQITAPFEGIVLDVLRDKGEWVNAGDAVLRLIRLDQLRVEGFLSVRDYNPEDVANRPVTVSVQRAHGQFVQLPGRVVFVSPLVQAGDKYRIRAEVENRVQDNHWVLRPGMSASMVIHVNAPLGQVSR